MKFRYNHLFELSKYTPQQINSLYNNTGYGNLCKNYNLAQQYLTTKLYQNQIVDVVQCDFCNLDKNINNCFVIFESDYLPVSFIQIIKKQSGLILVNSQWMRNVVLSETQCNENRIIKIPYLENFKKLDKYKSLKVQSKNKLVFYTIADYKYVKNLLNLFDAFNIAFKGYEDVQLIIKTSHAEFLQQSLYKRKEKFPKITIINNMLSQIEIFKLHLTGDVYISTALSVGWEIPPFQSSYFGNLLMCGNHSAFTQWVDFDNTITLESYKKVIPLREYSDGRFKNIHSGGWMINMIDTEEIIKKLIYVYNNYNELKSKKQDLSKFSIQNIDYWIQLNKTKQK